MQIDWIEGTLKSLFKGMTMVIVSELHQYFGDWEENEYGGLGYDASATVWESGRVFWSTARPQMGVHVRLPSTALASSGRDPEQVLCELHQLGAKFTRIDLAADDQQGFLDLKEIARKTVNKCEIVCQAHEGNHNHGSFGKTVEGHTEYYGSRKSETFVRIYDKAAEQRAKGKAAPDHWVRVEFEYKRARAHAVAAHIATHRADWRNAAKGWFLAYLDFKEPGRDSHKSRWVSCAWWLAFLEYASKVRLVLQKVVKTVADVKRWIEQQVAPSLFVLASTIGRDEIFQIIGEGSARLSQLQVGMIQSYAQMPGALEMGRT